MTDERKRLRRSKIDMQQLADLAGVSRSTVSRALSDSPRVTQKTKDKIRALAREHNYVINEVARNFRLRRTNIVGVMMMIESDTGQQHSYAFFLEMMGSIADALSAADYDMLLVHRPFSDVDQFLNSRVCQQSDGLIVVGQGHLHEQLNQLCDRGVPLAVWGAQLPGRHYPVIGVDNVMAARMAVDHLVEQGRRRIAFFGDTDLPEVMFRYQGYRDSLTAAGLEEVPEIVVQVPFDYDSAAAVIEGFLTHNPEFDGVFCCSDVIGIATIAALRNHELTVPDNVAVVGFDDIALAKAASPPLTTVRQNVQTGGAKLVQSVLKQIAGAEARDVLLDAELVIRPSSQ